MFRTVSLSIFRSLVLYTADCLQASSQLSLYDISIAVYTVLSSWWWTGNLSETCRVLFQKKMWEINASRWFYYKNISRCTVLWMSKNVKLFCFSQRLDCQITAKHGSVTEKLKICLYSFRIPFGAPLPSTNWVLDYSNRGMKMTTRFTSKG